jgi:hypothetical protein
MIARALIGGHQGELFAVPTQRQPVAQGVAGWEGFVPITPELEGELARAGTQAVRRGAGVWFAGRVGVHWFSVGGGKQEEVFPTHVFQPMPPTGTGRIGERLRELRAQGVRQQQPTADIL